MQQVLEAVTLEDRLEKALMVIKRERELVRVQQEISKQVDEKISGNQRKYFLMEQLKQIKKELGLEKDDKEALMAKYQERLEVRGRHQGGGGITAGTHVSMRLRASLASAPGPGAAGGGEQDHRGGDGEAQ